MAKERGGIHLWYGPALFQKGRRAISRQPPKCNAWKFIRTIDSAFPKIRNPRFHVFLFETPTLRIFFMAKLKNITDFTTEKPQKETQLEKTSRAVKAIIGEERDERHVKTERLRKARLEEEEKTPL